MKFLATVILAVSVIALARSAPQIFGNNVEGKDASIVSDSFEIIPNVSYAFNYVQSDLQQRDESGSFKPDPETNDKFVIDKVVGSYQFVRPDGLLQIVNYVADENGFQPEVTVQKQE